MAATPQAAAAPAAVLEVRIVRSDPTARATFTVARPGIQVALDVLEAVERQDPSLGFRFSCRSGFCGTCAIVIDGTPALACRTRLAPDRRAITLAPLGGFPVISDLIVDPSPLSDRWRIIAPAHGDLEPRIAEHLDCIACGLCMAACDAWDAGTAFAGPAVLTRLLVGLAGPDTSVAGGAVTGDVPAVGREDDVAPGWLDGCHGIGACSLVCPQGLDPARAIRRLRRRILSGAPGR